MRGFLDFPVNVENFPTLFQRNQEILSSGESRFRQKSGLKLAT
jgi:hypothetical protein